MDTYSEIILLLKYIFLGLVQGFTEPIPISSSGHVLILRHLFGLSIDGLSFEIIVNFGSLIAVLIIYREDILKLIKSSRFIITKQRKYQADFYFLIYLLVATFVTGTMGLMLKEFVKTTLNNITIVGVSLLITGFSLWLIRNLHGSKNVQNITLKDALIVGFAQAIALIPGISRSGTTIVAAMLIGMKRDTALRFSFLLYIPVSLGITMLSITDIVNDSSFNALLIPYLLAFIVSIIATFYALKWFMNIMARGKLKYFYVYCFTIGTVIILFM